MDNRNADAEPHVEWLGCRDMALGVAVCTSDIHSDCCVTD